MCVVWHLSIIRVVKLVKTFKSVFQIQKQLNTNINKISFVNYKGSYEFETGNPGNITRAGAVINGNS